MNRTLSQPRRRSWGKRGAEGEGPFGPGGPGDPSGPFVVRAVANMTPVERGMFMSMLSVIARQGMTGR